MGMAELLEEHDYELPEVGDIRQGIIVSISPQGMIVDLGLKRDGFVPTSDLEQLDESERQQFKLNDEVPVYVAETAQPDRLVVSIHKARLNEDWIHSEEMLESGEIFESPVIGYNRGGVIVPFGSLRGFVPASHLLEVRRGMDDRQRQQVMAKMKDRELPLKVIEVDRRRRRLVLSQRDAQKEWQENRKAALINSLSVGDVVRGRVSGLRDFGAFVDLGGADGLVHISELAWHRVNHPREVVKVGDEIEVYVLDLDRQEHRIALSRKKLIPNPWSLAKDKYAANQLVEGYISRIVDYGAFVEIEPGIEGLLHISQLSREPVEQPDEVIHEGETHLLRVISVDPERQRIGLSLKSVTANEQIQWMATHGPAEREAEETEEPASGVEEAPAAEEMTIEGEIQAVEEPLAETAADLDIGQGETLPETEMAAAALAAEAAAVADTAMISLDEEEE